jgi:hypothetical protein
MDRRSAFGISFVAGICKIPGTYRNQYLRSRIAKRYYFIPHINAQTINHPQFTMADTKTRVRQQVRVGVGVFVFNDAGSFVMGKRMGSHGAGRSLNDTYSYIFNPYYF